MQNKDDIWQALAAHQDAVKDASITPQFDAMHVAIDGALFDYSKHRVDAQSLGLLIDLARACDVEARRDDLFAGRMMNASEGRAVLHTALRGSVSGDPAVEGENVAGFVDTTLAQIKTIAGDIRRDADIFDVVNIGIGGSDMGPRLVCDALRGQADGPNMHFVSNVDGHQIAALLERLDPETTIFIVASKTFTTLETMQNARTAMAWSGRGDHFYAITGNAAAARDFGIADNRILPLRDWIGGRYSVWGAIGLPIAISLGFAGFEAFLDGAKAADDHFRSAALGQNIPVIMALLGVWYRNFWDYRAHAILPYAQDLAGFSAFVQQLDMESNGKSVDLNGNPLPHKTGPVVFGEPGTNAQHAFFQLLHQGSDIIPADFIAVLHPAHNLAEHHTALLANALAQSQALMIGQKNDDEPHRNFDGNRPSSTLILDRLDAHHLGMLIALYEHKIFVQGVIWGINSFDQWGVELGKTLAKTIAVSLVEGDIPSDLDSSSVNLIRHIIKNS